MARPQKRKTRPSWFQRQVERGGKDFLLRKSPQEIQRESMNIIRDIMRNNIIYNDFQYLFDLKILSNVKIAMYDKYIQVHTYDSALALSVQTPGGIETLSQVYNVDPSNFEKVFNKTRKELTIYCAVLNAIDTLIGFLQNPMPKAEEDYAKVYETIQYQLSKFKFDLN